MNYIKENYYEKLAMTDCVKQLNHLPSSISQATKK